MTFCSSSLDRCCSHHQAPTLLLNFCVPHAWQLGKPREACPEGAHLGLDAADVGWGEQQASL